MGVQLEELVEFLNSENYTSYIQNGFIVVGKKINNDLHEIEIEFDDYFPYTFPKIKYLRKSEKINFPHIGNDDMICTFDKSVSFPNVFERKRIVLEIVEKAFSIINDGINHVNNEDYIDEIRAYWELKSKKLSCIFVDNSNEVKELFKYENLKTKLSFISDSIEKCEKIAKKLNFDVGLAEPGLLIPISEIVSIPENDVDIYDLIKAKSNCIKEYEKFLRSNTSKKIFLVLCAKKEEDICFIGWNQYSPKTPNGFRFGHIFYRYALAKNKIKGSPFAIEDCSNNRLFRRGGDGHRIIINKACIIGCGSVGGFACENLLYYGTNSFILVDNEHLSYENVARHYAGFSKVSFYKTNAISRKLIYHNPNIMVENYNIDAFEFVDKYQTNINTCDIVIVSIAYQPFDYYINDLIKKKKINKPVLIIWTEPYCIAGHGLLINNEMDIFDKIYDKETQEFKNSVIKNGEMYSKREFGCQSTYIPYSAFYLTEMVNRLLVKSIELLSTNDNYLINWIGNVNFAKNEKIEINEKYKDFSEYTIEIIEL